MNKIIRIWRSFDYLYFKDKDTNELIPRTFKEAVTEFINNFYDYNKYFKINDCSLSGIYKNGDFISTHPDNFKILYREILKKELKSQNYKNSLNLKEDTAFDFGGILIFGTDSNIHPPSEQLSIHINYYERRNPNDCSLCLIDHFDDYENLNSIEKIDNFFKFLKENIDYIKLEYLEDYVPIISYDNNEK